MPYSTRSTLKNQAAFDNKLPLTTSCPCKHSTGTAPAGTRISVTKTDLTPSALKVIRLQLNPGPSYESPCDNHPAARVKPTTSTSGATHFLHFRDKTADPHKIQDTVRCNMPNPEPTLQRPTFHHKVKPGLHPDHHLSIVCPSSVIKIRHLAVAA